MPGTLFLLPNVLGLPDSNQEHYLLSVIPAPVLAITAKLDYFIAENAKTTRAFLKLVSTLHPLSKPIQEIRIDELNIKTETNMLPRLLQPLLEGNNAGLISEAGVPAVADPGADLVRMAHQNQIAVQPLVGPSSLLLAMMAGGLNGQSFAFNGYLPTDAPKRAKLIKSLEERSRLEKQTQIFIETPYRNQALLEALLTACRPDTLISLATDLTLPTEIVRTDTVAQWKKHFQEGKIHDFHKKPTVFSFLSI
jgi:16S rRNA (cytidine1402-2'-O)-methyltransferase